MIQHSKRVFESTEGRTQNTGYATYPQTAVNNPLGCLENWDRWLDAQTDYTAYLYIQISVSMLCSLFSLETKSERCLKILNVDSVDIIQCNTAKYSEIWGMPIATIPATYASELCICGQSDAQHGNKWTLIINVQNLH